MKDGNFIIIERIVKEELKNGKTVFYAYFLVENKRTQKRGDGFAEGKTSQKNVIEMAWDLATACAA